MQGRHDDDKAFEPHPDINDDRNDEERDNVCADFLDPQELRGDDIAGHHDDVGPAIGADDAIFERELFVRTAAIPGRKEFGEIGEADNGSRCEDDLGDGLQMSHGDVILEVHHLARDNEQRRHHRKTRKNGPDHEVGREDGCMPTGDDGRGKIHAHNRMDGDDQGCGQSRQNQTERLVTTPRPVGAVPADTQKTVNNFLPFFFGAIPKSGQIRDHPDVPKDQRDGEIGADGKNIPQERRTKIYPQGAARVGIGKNPEGQPGPPHMDHGKDGRTKHGKDGHRLGGPVDGRPPFLPEEQQDRRNQGPGMPDPDPKNKVGNIKGPANGLVQAPGPDAGPDFIGDQADTHEEGRQGAQKCRDPG